MSEKPPPYPDSQQGYVQQPGYPQQPGYAAPPPVSYPHPPPISGYPQQPGYPVATTTIVQQPTVIIAPSAYHEVPVSMCCPTCKATIVTSTEYVAGTLTWLACCGLCIIGCDAGCCFIPFCLDSMKDVVHTCPNCRSQVGVFRRM